MAAGVPSSRDRCGGFIGFVPDIGGELEYDVYGEDEAYELFSKDDDVNELVPTELDREPDEVWMVWVWACGGADVSAVSAVMRLSYVGFSNLLV